MNNETPLNEIIKDLLKQGSMNRPVYISDVRDVFDRHADTIRCDLCSIPAMKENQPQRFAFMIPKINGLSAVARRFVEEYLTAMMYNIISVFGGSALIGCCGASDSAEAKLLRNAFEPFSPYDQFNDETMDDDRVSKVQGSVSFQRSGAGKALNVAERTTGTSNLASHIFSFGVLNTDMYEKMIKEHSCLQSDDPMGEEDHGCTLAQAAGKLACIDENISAIGLDIGGSDIKVVVTKGDRIIAYREYDWFPTRFTEARQLVDSIKMIVRWGRDRVAVERLSDSEVKYRLIEELESVSLGYDHDEELQVVEQVERVFPEGVPNLHYIGLCFPDVVIRNKIVGGEVYKLRGIRESMQEQFETDYRKLTELDVMLSEFCMSGAQVSIINDGSMAAFTAAMESAFTEEGSNDKSIFAHTLGTELGTGWLRSDGTIPDIPLEVYNIIIDLGSRTARLYESDDARSIRNFNTDLPGTLQKYTSQSGVFRLAIDWLEPDRLNELYDRGYLVRDGESVKIASDPQDMRKPLLECIMKWAEQGSSEAAEEIFREIGRYLGITWLETEYLLSPESRKRVYFGRLVKMPRCFELIQEGASEIVPDLELFVADDSLAYSPLMQQLRDDGVYTVAQFAQAVGAVYYAMYRSLNL